MNSFRGIARQKGRASSVALVLALVIVCGFLAYATDPSIGGLIQNKSDTQVPVRVNGE